jgi:hypothetical protein
VTSNPFATRCIRPGAIPFVFSDGQSSAALVDRLREQNWRGQIIGPHGSGKSTLLATLIPALEGVGRHVILITLHQREHRLPPLDRGSFSASTQLIIDGYEQLTWWSRWQVKSLCRRTGAGLLATTHADVGLPTLFVTQSSESVARAVVSQLLNGSESDISDDDILTAFAATSGNLRETLFRLYDIYQQQRGQRD